MTLFVIIDEDIQIAKHYKSGRPAVFTSLNRLLSNTYPYTRGENHKYKIAEYDIETIYQLQRLADEYES